MDFGQVRQRVRCVSQCSDPLAFVSLRVTVRADRKTMTGDSNTKVRDKVREAWKIEKSKLMDSMKKPITVKLLDKASKALDCNISSPLFFRC